MRASYLVIIGDREALAWVLENQRMAFTAHRRGMAGAIDEGAELFIYATRGAFHNPRRDRGRVVGLARATTAAEPLPEPIALVGRTFELGCNLELMSLAPFGSGVELSPLVERLAAFPNKRGWKIWLRRPLLELPPPDATLLRRLLSRVSEPPGATLGSYLAAVPVVA